MTHLSTINYTKHACQPSVAQKHDTQSGSDTKWHVTELWC